MEQVKKARRPVSMVSYIGLSMVILGNAALIYYSLLWAPDYPVLGIDADIVLLFGGIICSIIGTVLSIIGLLQVLFSKRPLSQVTICTAAMIAEGFGILLLARIFPDPFAGRRYEAKNNLSAIYTAYQQYHSDYQTFPAEPLISIYYTTDENQKLGTSERKDYFYSCLVIADWAPKGNTRYAYECMDTVPYSNTVGDEILDCGVPTGATKDSFTVAACGNIDQDEVLDVWTMNDAKELVNVIDDAKYGSWAQVYAAQKKLAEKPIWQRIRDWF